MKKAEKRHLPGSKLKIKFEAAAAEVYPEILASHHTFYGETFAFDAAIQTFFYGRENIQAMAEAGKKHIVIEAMQEGQELVDKAARGRIDLDKAIKLFSRIQADYYDIPEDYAQKANNSKLNRAFWTAYLAGYRDMHEHGMKIHCIDDRSRYNQKGLRGIQMRQFYWQINQSPDPAPLSADESAFLSQRAKSGKFLAGRARDVASNEPAALFFTIGSGSMTRSIPDLKDVYLCASRRQYPSVEAQAKKLQLPIPRYVHFLDEGTVCKLTDKSVGRLTFQG